ncbi:hypothetical protein NDU88_002164 [Pleurodeles waltl]|uniref:Uncharacterized protein n=1 Tax=Pleurodeles waltl TaxID=8319 RepID=A0AAV7LBL0_PLEWA|nr:hypothetical protein NDU88_002164 [Pleurodeles waltl]
MGRVLCLLGQDPHVLGGRGQVRHLRPPWPVQEASKVSPRRDRSPVSRILRCHFCLPARSLSPHAGSVFVSAPPPFGALGPRSPAPRVATLPVLAIVHCACLRYHNTASQGHPGVARASLACLYVHTTPLLLTVGWMHLSLGQAPCALAGRGQVRHLRPPWPVWEASEVSSCHLRELSPVSQISCCRFCLLASSFSPHAGSVLVSAPPLSGALGPRSLGPRVATLPFLAIGHRACLRSHDTASQWHPRCVSGLPESTGGSTFGTYRV